MTQTIPVSQIVQVNPGVLTAAANALNLNGLILTQNTIVPIGAPVAFNTLAAVGSYFGLTSTEYQMASIYFAGFQNCTVLPALLYFAQYNSGAAVAAYLRGGSLLSVPLTTLTTYTGTLSVTVNGTVFTSTAISLTAATSFANAATIIQAGFTSPTFTVTYNAIQGAFVFTSNTTGAASTITFATGTLAASLLLTQATGAVTSQGAAIATPAPFMASLIAQTQNFAQFTLAYASTVAEMSAFALWTSSVAPRYAFVSWGQDANALTTNSTATLGYYVSTNALSGTVLIYGDQTTAAAVLAFGASLDFNRLNGRATLAFKSFPSILPIVTNGQNAATLISNGYTFYGAYGTANSNFAFMYNGAISGQYLWLDSYLNQIWLNANLQLAMITLLQSVASVPYNAQGYALVQSAAKAPIDAAVNFGAIRVGVNLSPAQITQMLYSVGQDISASIVAKGYYLSIVPATAAIRAARTSPSMTLYYADGGAIQQLTLASIEVQ